MAGRASLCDLIKFTGHICVLFTLIAARPLHYKKGYDGCPIDQVLTKDPGTISSPDNYSASIRCTWLIVAPQNTWITMQFSVFNVKSGPLCEERSCQWDYVQIQSYQQGGKRSSKTYCQGRNPERVISIASNKVRIHFQDNGFSKENGFVLKYWFEKRSNNKKSRSAKRKSPSHKLLLKLTSKQGKSHKVRRSASPSNISGVVVTYREDKEKEKKKEEDDDPPDEIVLGPSIPIILIFIGVVAAIAWWQFRSDQKERLRYYKERIRYEEISNRTKKRYKKKKQSLREIRMKKLYGDMARHWQAGAQTQGGSPNINVTTTKRSFAGRLLELAEKPVSYIRTPRGSRPSSAVVQEQDVPLVVMREKKDVSAGHQPPSRPASVLLRDALNMIFGATADEGETGSDSTKEPNVESSKEPAKKTGKESISGSESETKRESPNRQSLYDDLVGEMTNVKEKAAGSLEPQNKPCPENAVPSRVLIPHIMVRQPSCDGGDVEYDKKSPTIREIKVRSTSTKNKPVANADRNEEQQSEPELKPEETSPVQAASTSEQQQAEEYPTMESDPMVNDHIPDTVRPRSFEKKLVEMLEVLKNETEEFQNDDDNDKDERVDRNDETSLPPVPHQTPVPRESTSSMPPDGKTNCADLEDFLLNLDKELENEDEP